MTVFGLLRLVVGLTGQWLLGVFFARTLFGLSPHLRRADRTIPSQEVSKQRDSTPAELVGLGCVLGVGLTAWSLFVWSFLGGDLGLFASGFLSLVGYVTGGPLIVKWWRNRGSEKALSQTDSEPNRQERAVGATCQMIIAILFITTLLQGLQTPQKLWDERAIFALKAQVLFEDHSIDSPALLHPDFVQYHPRYPLLLPLAEQNIYALLGTADDRLGKLIFPVLYWGLVLTTAGVLQRHIGAGRAWLGALLMATVPVLMPYEYGFICGQADAPTACYHGLSVLYLWDSLTRQRHCQTGIGSLLMSGILGGLAAFTKDEGIAYLVIDGAILGLFAIGSVVHAGQTKRLILKSSLFIAAASIVLLPWFVHRRRLPMTTEMNYFGRMTVQLLLGRLNTLSWSVPHLFQRMFREWREWGLQWWLMLAAVLRSPARAWQPPQLLLLLDIAGALAAILVAGMLAPAQLDEHIGGSSHRFLMQIAPVAVLFAVTQFSDDNPSRNSEEAS